jgi:hypothetical protein
MIILIMFLCSFWGIILVNDVILIKIRNYFGFGPQRMVFSQVKWVDFILFCVHKFWNCPRCLSFWMFFTTYLVIYNSFLGFFIGIFVYYLTYFIQKIIKKDE